MHEIIPIHRVYDLENPKDRTDLTLMALNITEDKLLEIHDKMFKSGHRGHVSKLDKIFYHYLGKDYYDVMSRANFEYTFLEAEYLKINNPHEFGMLCEANRRMMWESAYSILPEIFCGLSINEIEVITEEEMREKLRQKYRLEDKLTEQKNI